MLVKSGTCLETRVFSVSVYSFIIEPFNNSEPFVGNCSVTISLEPAEVLTVKPAFSKVFLASATVLFVTLGRLIVLLEELSLELSLDTCIYGRISFNICAATGAATRFPLWPLEPVGSYNVTNRTISGFSVGLIATKEAVYPSSLL